MSGEYRRYTQEFGVFTSRTPTLRGMPVVGLVETVAGEDLIIEDDIIEDDDAPDASLLALVSAQEEARSDRLVALLETVRPPLRVTPIRPLPSLAARKLRRRRRWWGRSVALAVQVAAVSACVSFAVFRILSEAIGWPR